LSEGVRWNPGIYNLTNFEDFTVILKGYNNIPSDLAMKFTITFDENSNNVEWLDHTERLICMPIVISEDGILNQQIKKEFVPFIDESPLRPFCYHSAYYTEEIKITSSIPIDFTISGNVYVENTTQIPIGFTALTFTGSGSKFGSIYQAISLNYTDSSNSRIPITIEMPQIVFPNQFNIGSADELVMLRYDEWHNAFTYSPVDTFQVEASQSKYFRITVTLPDKGIYILGKIDYSLQPLFHVQPNYWVSPPDIYNFNIQQVGKQSKISIISSQTDEVALMDASKFIFPIDGYSVLESVYITHKSTLENITYTLSYNTMDMNICWG
jgi:hypothetical protein